MLPLCGLWSGSGARVRIRKGEKDLQIGARRPGHRGDDGGRRLLHARVAASPSAASVGRVPTGPVPVVAAQAKLADVPVWLEGVGSAKARNLVTVRPQVDGKILSINFKEGQEVKQGDLLAQIDPVTFKAQLDQADRQEGPGRGAARQRQARPRALHAAFPPTSSPPRPSTPSVRWWRSSRRR